MASHREIERKFLVKKPPTGWRRRISREILQGYFPMAGKDLEIRLRRYGSRHCITIKSGSGRSRLEEEIPISKSTFQSLWPLTMAARISKRRYKIPWEAHTIEMDVYRGPHRGLTTADIEFGSTRASRSFRPPHWLGREVTAHREYANESLARRHGVPGLQKRS